jgi:hypothetical protein
MQNLIAQNPSIKVLDTDFSKGGLTLQQTITLEDAVKLHCYLCKLIKVNCFRDYRERQKLVILRYGQKKGPSVETD